MFSLILVMCLNGEPCAEFVEATGLDKAQCVAKLRKVEFNNTVIGATCEEEVSIIKGVNGMAYVTEV